MILALAHSIYQECCKGKIEESWKVDTKKILFFYQFHEKLSEQMLQCNPVKKRYLANAQMCCVTSLQRENRGEGRKHALLDMNMFKKNKRFRMSRLLGNLNKLCHHIKSIEKLTNKPLVCAWCGEKTYTCCTICKGKKSKKKISLH